MPAILRGFLVIVFFAIGGNLTAQAETGERPIISFGDSYTEGYGASREEAYPSLLSRELKLPVINAGISGQTAGEALKRFERDVIVPNPRLVIVEFGVNEAYRGYRVEEAVKNLEAIVKKLKQKKIPVVLVGVRFRDFQENFEEGLIRISREYQTGLVLNVLEGVLGVPSLQSDAYHPNSEGYRMMFERILPEVKRVLNEKV